MRRVKPWTGRVAPLLLVLCCCLAALTDEGAAAMDEKKDEKEKLKACEKRMCEMIVRKAPATGDIGCELTKTWASKTIKNGAESSVATWDYGDARCSVELRLPRALVVEALAGPKVKLELPRHQVICEVERDGGNDTDPVRIELAPKVEFDNGRAKKVRINVKKVDGPSGIKSLVLTVAKVEDTVGLFQRRMLKAVNKFIRQKCPSVAAGK